MEDVRRIKQEVIEEINNEYCPMDLYDSFEQIAYEHGLEVEDILAMF